MIPESVQKPGKPLSPCPLLPAPCGLNDKSLTGHDITRRCYAHPTKLAKSSRKKYATPLPNPVLLGDGRVLIKIKQSQNCLR
ncbi:hypothetical protein NSTC731_04721 [Nostoc sp. DSM 114167]|jgi:hypothetical protein